MKTIFAMLILAAGTGGAQTVTVPGATQYQVNLTWTAPTGCTSTTPCTYNVYRVPGTVTIGAGTAGATLVGTTASQTVAYSDTTVATGTTYSYAVETIQGGANSVPSNTFTVAIPLVPGAPAGLSGSVGP